MNPHTLRNIGIAGLVAVAAAFLTIGCVVVSKSASKSAARSAADSAVDVVLKLQRAACDRNQIQRAYDILDERVGMESSAKLEIKRTPVASYYLAIVNCNATYSRTNVKAVGIFLRHDDQECFLNLVQRHYWSPRESPTTDPRELRRICAELG